MHRFLVSILVLVAFVGASAAAEVHGLKHSLHNGFHHIETPDEDLLVEAEKAIADCCDATSGMGSVTCLGDVVGGLTLTPIAPLTMAKMKIANAVFELSSLSLSVPTGPPKG